MAERYLEVIDLDPVVTGDALRLLPGASLHIGKNPTASPKRLARRCPHDDYVTLTGREDGALIACHRSAGAWLFELGEGAVVDERIRLLGVTSETLGTSVAARTGHGRHTLTRWLRTDATVIEMHDHVGVFTLLTARDAPRVVRAPARLFVPRGHVYELDLDDARRAAASYKTANEGVVVRQGSALPGPNEGRDLESLLAQLARRAPDGACVAYDARDGRVIAGHLPDGRWLVRQHPDGVTDETLDGPAFAAWALKQHADAPLVLRDLRDSHSRCVAHGVMRWESAVLGPVVLVRPLATDSGTDEDVLVQRLVAEAPSPARASISPPDELLALGRLPTLTSTDVAFATLVHMLADATRGASPRADEFVRTCLVSPVAQPWLARMASLLLLAPIVHRLDPSELSVDGAAASAALDVATAAAVQVKCGAPLSSNTLPWGELMQIFTARLMPSVKLPAELLAEFTEKGLDTGFSQLADRRKGRREALWNLGLLDLLLTPGEVPYDAETATLSSGITIRLKQPEARKAMEGGLTTSNPDVFRALLARDGAVQRVIDRRRVQSAGSFLAIADRAREALARRGLDKFPELRPLL
jgi:hypothetical protein